MNCPFCNGQVIHYRQVNANGAKVIILRCSTCHKIPDPKHPFYSVTEDWVTLPFWYDYSQDSIPCCVIDCKNIGTELHHFAPRHLFGNSNDWPVGFLCGYHHDLWHKLTRTGSYGKHS